MPTLSNKEHLRRTTTRLYNMEGENDYAPELGMVIL